MGKKQGDPLAKRAGETHQQWQMRIALAGVVVEDKDRNAPNPFTMNHGDYRDGFVTDVETGQKAKAYRRRVTSSLARLNMRGVITDDQLYAAQEVALIAERIGRDVCVTVASLTGRVDCEGSGKDHAIEGLNRVRSERAYSEWRLALPIPRRMVLDMVIEDHQLVAIARRHNRDWRTAIGILKNALDNWHERKREAFDRIDQDDVDMAVRRIA